MAKTLTFSFPSTGGWEYSFELKESDARLIIAGVTDDQIQLSDPKAMIIINPDTITLAEQTTTGYRHEEFPREKMIAWLRQLLFKNTWG
jgi:hypothetical protein